MNVANNNKPMNIMDMHVENYAPLSDGGPSNRRKAILSLYLTLVVMKQVSGDFFGPIMCCCMLYR